MKVYDCFSFYNELDLLELRFRTLDKYVDYFIVSESPITYSGKKKNFIFEENKNRFKKWEDKIIYVKTPKIRLEKWYFLNPNIHKKWIIRNASDLFRFGRRRIEAIQKDCIFPILKRICKKNDLILISDIDEIPNPKKIGEAKSMTSGHKVVGFNQKMYYYYLNGFANFLWIGTKACRFETLAKKFNGSLQDLRISKKDYLLKKLRIYRNNFSLIKNGGWHFSYLGSMAERIKKIESICHAENDTKDNKNLISMEEKIRGGMDLFGRNIRIKYVKLDNSFPSEILENKEKYKKLIF